MTQPHIPSEMVFSSPPDTQDIARHLTLIGGLSLVIPVRVFDASYLAGFQDHYSRVIQHMKQVQTWELIIVDASLDSIFALLDDWFATLPHVHHIRPAVQDIPGHNNKLLSLREALLQARFRYTLLLDHDMRPSFHTICEIALHLPEYDCARCMIHYQVLHMGELINVNGIFLVNLLCRDKQFWGHLILNRETLLSLGFPATNTLFDELTLTRHFQKYGKRVGYFSTITISMASRDSCSRFFEQRLRYAYENLAYPFRFTLFLSILPLLLISGFFSLLFTLILFLGITCGLLLLGYLGQKRYGNGLYPFYTFLYAPLWFWPYPFTSWLALLFLLTGGVKFGGQTIRRPA